MLGGAIIIGESKKDVRVTPILAMTDFVPSFDEVLDDIEDAGTCEGHVDLHRQFFHRMKDIPIKNTHIVPRHPGRIQHINGP
jgi:hypothetical protein